MTAEQAAASSEAPATEPAVSGDRPLPFVLRVAARWVSLDMLPHSTDGQLLFRQRAPLTGRLALTGDGRDVQVSDVGV